MPSGWARLGDALGGDTELSYEKGLQLGANTENALAEARERVTKAKEQQNIAAAIRAAGGSEARASGAQTFAMSGLDPTKLGDLLGQEQEFGFRATAGNPATSITDANAALRGVASGPVDRYQKVGNGADDRFDEAGVQPLPGGAQDGGGSAAFIQAAKAYGLIDPATGMIREGKDPQTGLTYRELAYAVQRISERGADAGGVPQSVNTNIFSPAHGVATAVVTPEQTAANAAEVERQKTVGKGTGEAQLALGDTVSDINKMRTNITELIKAPGFKGVYGNFQGQPGVRTALGLADSDIQDAQIRLKNIDAQTFGVAVQKMRGLGQLSNAEGIKVTDALTRAVDPRNSDTAAMEAWEEVLTYLDAAELRANRKAAGPTPPTVPSVADPAAPAVPATGKVLTLDEYLKSKGH